MVSVVEVICGCVVNLVYLSLIGLSYNNLFGYMVNYLQDNNMELILWEKDKLLFFVVFQLVECCKGCGLKLNYFEVVVFILFEIIEGVWDGKIVVELMDYGCILLICDEVMEGVLEMIYDVQVEVIFFDGIKLVIVYDLIVQI